MISSLNVIIAGFTLILEITKSYWLETAKNEHLFLKDQRSIGTYFNIDLRI